MAREYTTEFEQKGRSELLKLTLDEGFEQDFILGGDFYDEITPKQRLALWGLFFKYVNEFPDDMKPIIEQVSAVCETQMEVAVSEVSGFSKNLIYRLRIPFQNR